MADTATTAAAQRARTERDRRAEQRNNRRGTEEEAPQDQEEVQETQRSAWTTSRQGSHSFTPRSSNKKPASDPQYVSKTNKNIDQYVQNIKRKEQVVAKFVELLEVTKGVPGAKPEAIQYLYGWLEGLAQAANLHLHHITSRTFLSLCLSKDYNIPKILSGRGDSGIEPVSDAVRAAEEEAAKAAAAATGMTPPRSPGAMTEAEEKAAAAEEQAADLRAEDARLAAEEARVSNFMRSYNQQSRQRRTKADNEPTPQEEIPAFPLLHSRTMQHVSPLAAQTQWDEEQRKFLAAIRAAKRVPEQLIEEYTAVQNESLVYNKVQIEVWQLMKAIRTAMAKKFGRSQDKLAQVEMESQQTGDTIETPNIAARYSQLDLCFFIYYPGFYELRKLMDSLQAPELDVALGAVREFLDLTVNPHSSPADVLALLTSKQKKIESITGIEAQLLPPEFFVMTAVALLTKLAHCLSSTGYEGFEEKLKSIQEKIQSEDGLYLSKNDRQARMAEAMQELKALGKYNKQGASFGDYESRNRSRNQSGRGPGGGRGGGPGGGGGRSGQQYNNNSNRTGGGAYVNRHSDKAKLDSDHKTAKQAAQELLKQDSQGKFKLNASTLVHAFENRKLPRSLFNACKKISTRFGGHLIVLQDEADIPTDTLATYSPEAYGYYLILIRQMPDDVWTVRNKKPKKTGGAAAQQEENATNQDQEETTAAGAITKTADGRYSIVDGRLFADAAVVSSALRDRDASESNSVAGDLPFESLPLGLQPESPQGGGGGSWDATGNDIDRLARFSALLDQMDKYEPALEEFLAEKKKKKSSTN